MDLLETVARSQFNQTASVPLSSRSAAYASSQGHRQAVSSSEGFEYQGILGSGTARSHEERTYSVHVQTSAETASYGAQKNVPTLSSTVLQLELLLGAQQGNCRSRANGAIDLAAVGALVLSDLGATVQVLKLAGRKHQLAEDRPRSIEHCIANSRTGTWFGAVSAQPFARDHFYAVAASLWEHSKIIAHYAKLIAASTPGVNPDEAYLCGLLHDLGKLPEALGWATGCSGSMESAHIGPILARNWCLPGFLIDALDSQSASVDTPDRMHVGGSLQSSSRKQSWHKPWTEILSTAHELAITFDGRQPGLLQ